MSNCFTTSAKDALAQLAAPRNDEQWRYIRKQSFGFILANGLNSSVGHKVMNFEFQDEQDEI